MKKFIFLILITALAVCCALPAASTAFAEEKPYRSIFLIDYDTGTVIIEENADERYPIASMVKIMTLALTFDEIDKGKLSIDEKIRISDYAAGMGGSQMFLDAGEEYPVTDLIKGVIVCSANDAATALGERISGDIESFVSRMNSYAKELGMNNTLFCNATGLPNSGEQYSTARDVSVMMKKVLSHPEYYKYSRIWMENYEHPDGRITELVNTNKLIRIMNECDGGKTGFTNEAGFCLSASAKVGETRVIATLLGGKDSKTRFNKVSEMMRYAFANYETKVFVKKNEIIPCNLDNIQQAKNPFIEIYSDSDVKYFGKKGENNLTPEVTLYDNLKAPIETNTKIGEIVLKDSEGNIVSSAGLLTKEKIEKLNFWDYLKKIINNRIFKK